MTTRVLHPSAQGVYASAARWRETCLLDDRSLFGHPEGSSLQDAETLVRDFIGRPDEGTNDFLTKLSRQLSGSPASAIQLAAELLYVHFLLARSSTIKGPTKREIITKVLRFREGTTPIPRELGQSLDSGLINPGLAFGSYRWKQFAYLIDFVTTVKRLPISERREVLGDPERFIEATSAISDAGSKIQRYSIEHLFFPDYFPAVVSQDHRAAILEHWSQIAGAHDSPESIRMHAVAASLESEGVTCLNFYRSPLRWQWQQPDKRWLAWVNASRILTEYFDLDETERRYKIAISLRLGAAREATLAGSSDWADCIKVALTKDNNLLDWRTKGSFLSWLSESPDDARKTLMELWRANRSESIDRFEASLPLDVLRGQGARLGLTSVLLGAGGFEDQPPWRSDATERAYKLCGFGRPEPGATTAETYAVFLEFLDMVVDIAHREGVAIRDRLDAQGLIRALVTYPLDDLPIDDRNTLLEWRGDKPSATPAVAPPISDLEAPEQAAESGEQSQETLADIASDLHLDEAFLREIVDLVEDKGQVILYGPPGTGKTYVARRLAVWLAGDAKRTRLVQFHPSYAYEDFVEGLRPRADSAGFHLVDGPLKKLATRAREDSDNTYVLLVDEINRGNVARVFGELYFLLEYRDEPAELLYSSEAFSMPRNLMILATMNSADRSIALLDSALRRRFYFVGFQADSGVVSEVLPQYLAQHNPEMVWVADVVALANKLLDDPSLAIGPSHFLRKDLDDGWVRRAWEHAVLPTLADHFYGQEQRLAEFELDTLRSKVGQGGDGDEPPAP